MEKTYELDQDIKELIKKDDYKEAINIFKNSFKSGEISKADVLENNYLICDLIKCYRKLKWIDKGIEFIKYMGIEINKDQDTFILKEYGWLLYYKYKNISEINIGENEEEDFDILRRMEDEKFSEVTPNTNQKDYLFKAVENILPFLDSKSKYSSFSKLFRKFLKVESHKIKPNWLSINELLGKIDKNSLSKECEMFETKIKGKMKTVEMASDKESWYSYKTKALLEVRKFEECFNLSNEALILFSKFHHNNDIWFARRIALCKKELGDINTAIQDLQEILKRKKDWFIYAELSALYYDSGQYEEALKHACYATQSFGDNKYKLGLFYNIARIMEALNDMKYAYLHVLLVKMIREKEGWKIGSKISDSLKKYKNESDDFSYNNMEVLYNYLKQFWKEKYPLESDKYVVKKMKGKVKSLRRDREFGFISGEDNKEYYFRFSNVKDEASNIREGVFVLFQTKSPTQEGKNPIAFDIRFLHNQAHV
ncbi:MAG: cold shock domain-containing protein [Melioribacteraceae bacterium]|nr:cold shock domain-containing protein [Melioribacteraceae bacterium]